MEKVVTIGREALHRAVNQYGAGRTAVRPDGTWAVRERDPGGDAEDDVEVRPASEPEVYELRPRTLLGQLFVSLLIAGG